MLRLVIEDGEGTTHVVPLIRDEITVGRQEGNTLRLTERNVSRRHARLTRTGLSDDSPVIIEDLHSYNGIRVNGEQVAGQCSLRPDDTIQIGDYFLALEVFKEKTPVPTDTMVTSLLAAPETAQIADEAQARLVVVSSNLAGQEYRIDQRESLIGRTETDGNSLVVNHRSISRNHAKVIYRDGQYTLIDLGSSNGVLINGQALSSASLVTGDIIEMGHVKFRFCAPGDEYRFTVADIDDVFVPEADHLNRLLVVAVILLTFALGAYVITGSLDQVSQNGINESEPTQPKRNIVQPIVEDASQAATEGSGGVAAAEIDGLLTQAAEFLESQNWQTANSIYSKILRMAPENAEARAKLALCQREMGHRGTVRSVQKLLEQQRWEESLALLAGVDAASVYMAQATGLRSSARSGYLRGLETVVNDAIAEKNFFKARERANKALRYEFARPKVKQLLSAIDSAESRRARANGDRASNSTSPSAKRAAKPRQRSRAPSARKKRRTTQPERRRSLGAASSRAEESAPCSSLGECHSRFKTMYYKAGVKSPAILRSCESILRRMIRLQPNHPLGYSELCRFLERRGRISSAIKACKDWRKRESSPGTKATIEGKIRALKKKL